MARVEEPPRRVHRLHCIECGCVSGLKAVGWRGFRVDDPDLEDVPEVAFYCPTCADRELSGQ